MADNSVHIVGAGLAGLSAATSLTGMGYRIHLYESAGHAGGRCRSFHDDRLGCEIDNGNHLMLSGNRSTGDYVRRIDADDRLVTAERAAFPFMDASTGERWTLDLGAGAGAWRLLLGRNGERRGARRAYGIPGVTRLDALSAFRFAHASPDATVYDQLGGAGPVYHRLWAPLSLAVLNTEPDNAVAGALWPVLRETLGRGPDNCRPVMAKQGLSHALVDPALEFLRRSGAEVRLNATLKAVETDASTGAGTPVVAGLRFAERTISIGAGDRVILALPIAAINALLPDLITPNEFRPIVNAHFRVASGSEKLTFMGLINADAHWIFRRNNVLSVTVSAATSLVEDTAERIADILWRDVAQAVDVEGDGLPVFRVVKEKRATFAQTPAQDRRRPGAGTAYANLFLAGDWTATGLPATIEGAVRSGVTAAGMCQG